MKDIPVEMEPASANRGFFQQHPVLKNQFHDDVSFQRILKCEPPPCGQPDMSMPPTPRS